MIEKVAGAGEKGKVGKDDLQKVRGKEAMNPMVGLLSARMAASCIEDLEATC